MYQMNPSLVKGNLWAHRLWLQENKECMAIRISLDAYIKGAYTYALV